jgi:UrcA family protein
MSNFRILSFIAAFAILPSGVAFAGPSSGNGPEVVVKAPMESEFPTRYVTYSDLNLAHPAGLKTLNGRVNSAVREVCRESTAGSTDFYLEMGCRSFAWDGARPQINRAVERATQIAANGFSTIAPVRISLSVR